MLFMRPPPQFSLVQYETSSTAANIASKGIPCIPKSKISSLTRNTTDVAEAPIIFTALSLMNMGFVMSISEKQVSPSKKT